MRETALLAAMDAVRTPASASLVEVIASRRRVRMKDLYLVGLGIDFDKHLTTEAREVLTRCRILLHIGNEHRWLKRFNKNVVDLQRLYLAGDERQVVYDAIVDRVMAEMKNGPGVALATYGNPMIFNSISNQLRDNCRRRRCSCQIVAGISSLDTIPSDLSFDYLEGAQIYGSTSLVLNRFPLNNRAMTLLLQVGVYNFKGTAAQLDLSKPRFGSLIKYLRKFYPASHPAIFVYSNDGTGKRIVRMRLSEIERNRRKILPGMTLCLPPVEPRET